MIFASRYTVLVCDDNSDMGAHLRSHFCYLNCLRYLIRPRAKLDFLNPKRAIFPPMCAKCSELPSNISTMHKTKKPQMIPRESFKNHFAIYFTSIIIFCASYLYHFVQMCAAFLLRFTSTMVYMNRLVNVPGDGWPGPVHHFTTTQPQVYLTTLETQFYTSVPAR